jgi:hypothetical protein
MDVVPLGFRSEQPDSLPPCWRTRTESMRCTTCKPTKRTPHVLLRHHHHEGAPLFTAGSCQRAKTGRKQPDLVPQLRPRRRPPTANLNTTRAHLHAAGKGVATLPLHDEHAPMHNAARQSQPGAKPPHPWEGAGASSRGNSVEEIAGRGGACRSPPPRLP